MLTYIQTEKLTVSTGAPANSTIANAARPILLAVSSDVAFHALIDLSTASPAADTNAPYFPTGNVYVFTLPAGAEISIRGAAAGSAWVSEVTQS